MAVSAGLAVVAVGAGYSAYSSMKAGSAQQGMFQRNAQFAEAQAVDAESRGRVNEQRQRETTEGVIGSQRTSFAAQGVDVNKGSSLDVQADSAYLGELDALTIRNNAAREAWGFRVGAEDLRQQGRYAREAGQMQGINTILGAGGSLLLARYGGYGSYSGRYGGRYRPGE